MIEPLEFGLGWTYPRLPLTCALTWAGATGQSSEFERSTVYT